MPIGITCCTVRGEARNSYYIYGLMLCLRSTCELKLIKVPPYIIATSLLGYVWPAFSGSTPVRLCADSHFQRAATEQIIMCWLQCEHLFQKSIAHDALYAISGYLHQCRLRTLSSLLIPADEHNARWVAKLSRQHSAGFVG